MKFYWFYCLAWLRGLFYRWPNQGPIPQGYTGVSCGLRDFGEVRVMFGQGWIPYRFQRTGRYGTARLFLTKSVSEK